MALNIKELKIRNFRSYGDYDTILRLDNLGPALIVGELDDVSESNGAGKTSIVDALVWCLFGRVPTKDKPGDAVVNWESKKDCSVSITTADGYIVTRTRGVDGHDDLLVHNPDGKEESLSTNPNTQQYLNKLFNLDYDIFMSSVFFGQFSKPFLELPDQKRKKALERMLHLTKYDVYAEVAKEKAATLELEQTKHQTILDNLTSEVMKLTQRLDNNMNDINTFETERKESIDKAKVDLSGVDGKFAARASELEQDLQQAQSELDAIHTYDITQLEASWEKYENEEQKLLDMREKITKLNNDIIKASSEKKTLEAKKIDLGSPTKIAELSEQLEKAKDELSQFNEYHIDKLKEIWTKHDEIITSIDTAKDKIDSYSDDKIKLESERNLAIKEIEKWKGKTGNICPECKQTVEAGHAHSMSDPLEIRVKEIIAEIEQVDANILQLEDISVKLAQKAKKLKPEVSIKEAESYNAQIQSKRDHITTITETIEQYTEQKNKLLTEEKLRQDKIKQLSTLIETKRTEIATQTTKNDTFAKRLEEMKPEVTTSEAQLIKKSYDSKQSEIEAIQASIDQLNEQKKQVKEDIKNNIKKLTNDANPYQKIRNELLVELETVKNNQAASSKKVKQFNLLIKHINYIKSSYSDRRKIKAHTIGQMVPYLNERIRYYLDALNCNFSLELNAFLQIKSKKWPYEQNSGGERKRIDLAVMFAIYDLHSSIYEQKCNVLVLDEVDGRLDASGITHFVNLLYKEFIDNKNNDRPTSLLVISHKNEMRDAFPSKILVKKENDCSKIIEVA